MMGMGMMPVQGAGPHVQALEDRKATIRGMSLTLVRYGVVVKDAPMLAIGMYDEIEKHYEGQMADARKKDKELRDKMKERRKKLLELQRQQNKAMEPITSLPHAYMNEIPLGGYAGSEDFLEDEEDEGSQQVG